jgi:hypothetical protein
MAEMDSSNRSQIIAAAASGIVAIIVTAVCAKLCCKCKGESSEPPKKARVHVATN